MGESAENLELMRLLDEQYTRTPFYGVRRMTNGLEKQGRRVNAKRVRRLMRQMGLEAIYPKPRLSTPAPGHRIYPYQLRGLRIDRPNQVWATEAGPPGKFHGFVNASGRGRRFVQHTPAVRLQTVDALGPAAALGRRIGKR